MDPITPPQRLLLVDDEVNVLNALVRALRLEFAAGALQIETFSDPFKALERCCECDFDIVISDQRMPGMTGVEFLHALKEVAPSTVRMMLSASTEFSTVASAISEAHVFRYIPKPWSGADLQQNISAAISHRAVLVREQQLADQQRRLIEAQQSDTEREAAELEEEEPGITRVNWGPNGEVIL